MKKLFVTLSLIITIFAFNVNAKTLDEKIAAVETKYEQRINKIDTMRATNARKEVLKVHARENADLKIKQLKDLEALKTVKAEKKIKKSKK